MQFQVRSATKDLEFFDSFSEAYNRAKQVDAYKLSYSLHRWIKLRKGEQVFYTTHEELCNISDEYKNAPEGSVFWYNQPLEPEVYILDGKRDIKFVVKEILSDEKFGTRY